MATPGIDPTFYADFNGLTELKKNVKADDPRAIRAAAQQFESLFTDMMLKSMREAKLGEGLGDSDQSDFYQDMYDQQLSLQISQGKGLGLADMLVQQLTRRGLVHGAAAGSAGADSAAGAAGTVSPATAAHGAHAAHGARGGIASRGAEAAGTAAAPSAPHGNAATVTEHQRIGFIRAMTPYAQRAGAALGVSPDSLIGQAALETGWGQHVPSVAGGPSSNNLFGVKAGTGWQGASVSALTTEYQDGAATRPTQSFRAYSSVQQGVNDYVTLLRREPAYQAALGTGDDVGAFAAALQHGGYATDPDYVQKLSATVAAVRALKLQAGAPITGGTMTHRALNVAQADTALAGGGSRGAVAGGGEEPA